jgi:hypothetical protein
VVKLDDRELNDWYRVAVVTLGVGEHEVKEWGQDFSGFGVYDRATEVLRLSGLVIGAWHLMTNEWRIDFHAGGRAKEYPPPGEDEIVELRQTTNLTASIEDCLVLSGVTETSEYLSDRSLLMSHESVLENHHRVFPGE